MKILFYFIFLSFFSQAAFGSEVASLEYFSYLKKEENPSQDFLNKITNEVLQNIVENFSNGKKDPFYFYAEKFDKKLGSFIGVASIEKKYDKEVKSNPKKYLLPHFSLNWKDHNLFKTMPIDVSTALYSYPPKVPAYMCGMIIGVDKIAHILSHGLRFYKLVEKKGMDKALQDTINQEKKYWGLYTTKIYSYADAVANIQGYFFWKQFLSNQEGSILSTHGGVTKVNQPIDWCSYLLLSMDESINCSTYHEALLPYAQKMREKQNFPSCPVSANKCPLVKKQVTELLERLGLSPKTVSEYLPSFVSPACL